VPARHILPTAPQLFELFSRFTHEVTGPSSPNEGAATSLPGHDVVQAPFTHACPDGHAWPHAPQFIELSWRMTQSPSHSVSVAGQPDAHVPPTQTWSLPHNVPHSPQ
jgi:hypothetical protein